MNKTYRTTGIVLKRKDWREDDSLFTLFTEDYGKVNLVAAGSRKIKSKLMGHLSTYGLVDIMAARSKRQDRLATARLIDNFKINLEKDHLYINYFFELLDKTLEEGEVDKNIWQLVNHCIEWVQMTKTEEQKKLVLTYFTLQLFKNLGYHPELFTCSNCNQKVNNQVYFSLQNNGLICHNCHGEKKIVSQDMIKLMRVLISDNLESFEKLVVKRKVINELVFFLRNWVPYVTERQINTIKYV